MTTENTNGLLRFITAGSVDDGKSTLIGRLLFDSKAVLSDQLLAVRNAKHKRTIGEQIDFSLLTDGLEAEREQGITIDVAYRYFSTAKRKFIIADTPGHEQYTRNMVTGASTADAAVVLIDPVRALDAQDNVSLLAQTRRHSALLRLLGIRHIVVAVNKMDLIGFDQQRFEKICDAYAQLATQLGLTDVRYIPVSALGGDNVVTRSENMPWYQGQPLLSILESLELAQPGENDPAALRFPVQLVVRQDGNQADDFRGYMGKVAGGQLSVGQALRVLPGNQTGIVKEILGPDGEVSTAVAGDVLTISLDRDIDVSRGDIFVAADAQVEARRDIHADLCWFDADPLQLKRKYLLRHTFASIPVRINRINKVLDVKTLLNETGSEQLRLNDIGEVQLTLQKPLVSDSYDENAVTGSFILIDEVSNNTVAAGIIKAVAKTA